ncbi:MAG: hypothetical protein JO283_18195 [Bradyrhizobium sp.]|nr:hypothetical protein [Bradyrhizobium sp.]
MGAGRTGILLQAKVLHEFSLNGRWVKGNIERRGNWLSFAQENALAGGMSGSPIVSPSGEAIGVMSFDTGGPVLVDSLPAWLVRAIRAVRRAEH